jgi:hypothetical protein
MYCVKDAQSELYYEWQNPVERTIQDIKKMVNSVMARVGCPAGYWLLCALYVIGLLNVLVNSDGVIPKTAVTGQPTDCSAYLNYHFWQPVFAEDHFHKSKEFLGLWVGVAENTGDALTYLVLNLKTGKVVPRSNVRPAKDPMFPNRSLRPDHTVISLSDGGEVKPPSGPIYDVVDAGGVDPSEYKLPLFSPEELLGLTFLRDGDHGQKFRAKVVKQVMDREAENNERIKFLVSLGDGEYEEIMAYNELSDLIERQHTQEASGELEVFTFKGVTDHQGPLRKSDPRYKGSSYNVLMTWEDGSKSWEPVSLA